MGYLCQSFVIFLFLTKNKLIDFILVIYVKLKNLL